MIKEYKCTYDHSEERFYRIAMLQGLLFPDVYKKKEEMKKMANLLHENTSSFFYALPFDHVVESEAMGAKIQYGDERFGPRAGQLRYRSLEELEGMESINLNHGRIKVVLDACEELVKEKKEVLLEISGPFTILNSLIDLTLVLKGMRKQPEKMAVILKKIENELLRYVEEAIKRGVSYISYADPVASVSVIGPKMMEEYVELFTYSFLKEVEQKLENQCLVLLCPKTSYALVGTGKAVFIEHDLEKEMSYGEACKSKKGIVHFSGQICSKKSNHKLKNRVFKEIVLC